MVYQEQIANLLRGEIISLLPRAGVMGGAIAKKYSTFF